MQSSGQHDETADIGDLRRQTRRRTALHPRAAQRQPAQDAGSGVVPYALVELLSERGIITIDELDARQGGRQPAADRAAPPRGRGRHVPGPGIRQVRFEHAAEFDCAARVHLCRATCCRLPFALSHQDVREGIVRWNLGQPYVIDQDGDGYCAHMDRGTCGCTIYAHRPVPCRGFDCRKDRRIWLDFESHDREPGRRAARLARTV